MEQNKKYGGITLFLGFVLLLCSALVAYNLYFMQIFKNITQTYEALCENANNAEKLVHTYVSLYARFFGEYPSTQVLSVLVPVTLGVIIAFVIYFDKYLSQRKNEKMTFKEATTDDQPAI